jgi:hypothetical protein
MLSYNGNGNGNGNNGTANKPWPQVIWVIQTAPIPVKSWETFPILDITVVYINEAAIKDGDFLDHIWERYVPDLVLIEGKVSGILQLYLGTQIRKAYKFVWFTQETYDTIECRLKMLGRGDYVILPPQSKTTFLNEEIKKRDIEDYVTSPDTYVRGIVMAAIEAGYMRVSRKEMKKIILNHYLIRAYVSAQELVHQK